MAISGSTDSDFIQINGERDRVGILAESLLENISEFTKSVVSIDVEKENFIEIGSYLYRASALIMELQIGTNTTSNVIDKLQSMLGSVHLANELIKKGQNYRQKNQLIEPSIVIEQLHVVNRHVAEGLSLIPSSFYGEQECAEIAAKSLSKDMKSAAFVARKILVSDQKELEVHMFTSREFLTNETAERDTETDLYSINIDVSMENIRLADSTNIYISDNSRSSISRSLHLQNHGNCSARSESEYMEPLYETFFCPLTKKIMEDPVTIESGVTYEKEAISEWINKFDNHEEISCPKSGQKLKSRNLSTNVALKATIDEWKERNETARIKAARAALSSASSTQDIILKAIEDLQIICLRKPYNKVQVLSIGIIPLLGNLLDNRSRSIRCATLELLRHLAEDDDEELIAQIIDISTVTRMLSSNHRPIRHASLSLLLEVSKSQFLCDNIGEVPGAILMLITAKYRHSDDAFVADKADEVLKSLEKYPCNIKHMAENGYLEPLLYHLIEGSEEMKMEMARYLGEIVLGLDSITYVAEKASPSLIKMVESGNSLSRNAAFGALQQISSHHSNANTLVESGLVQIMVEEIFTQAIHDEQINSKKEAAGILANVLESGLELENLQVNGRGHTLASDYMIFNFIQRIKNSTPEEMNFHLVRILICLMKYPKASSTIISVIKETDASYNLIELINNPNEELSIVALKLLIAFSPFMGHTISDRLCKTKGQPESLIHAPPGSPRVTEKQAVSATLLAKLPHQNMTLNLALVNKNTIPAIIEQINKIHVSGTRTSRYTSAYFDGLVGILVRLTTILYDHQILHVVRTFNFTYIFTELLVKTSSDEVKKLSAIGLGNLSKQSVNLSKPPPIKNNKYIKSFLLRRCMSLHSKTQKVPLCPVHRGVCSAEDSFCLIDAKAIERLLSCLHHENVEVVEAALSAISTLLDDKVDMDKSVNLLIEMQTIQHVLNVVKEHREDVLWHKSFWLIEKFLSKGGDKSASDISQDRLFPATVVSAFQHGDICTRQMAEKILMHLNKMPYFANTASFTT
ncbi:PREDICTED: putative U-box domain-containing protein 42 [Nicotiana attenuata]|uniref:putative U-box domain-containing protein 42 n=1 Tax=Nicotiana attenuata TaxID=49451 RepID=UPI000904F1FA|nr:PREDICTED: putative U-box domain-containing protein 42 [Nicotiana attenuata]